MKRLLLFCAALCCAATSSAQKWEGLADTPPMGWSTWNKFGCNVDERMVREMADALVESGLAEAGYVYLNIDDCWHASERDADGFPQCDPERFPGGMKALADYVHSKGLKLGIYSDAGRRTCAGRFGSFGHEYQDALQYARWGIDYLKYDWCNTENINPVGAYTLMRDALRAAGRPILFSMCEWGNSKPWTWAREVGHMWRTTGDIGLSFSDPAVFTGDWKPRTVMQNFDDNAGLRRHAGPGHWNDPDMLEVGNGMSVNQDRAHFTMWCMMAAPLILGNDIRAMSDETAAIVTDRDVIAIDQDHWACRGCATPPTTDWKSGSSRSPAANGPSASSTARTRRVPIRSTGSCSASPIRRCRSAPRLSTGSFTRAATSGTAAVASARTASARWSFRPRTSCSTASDPS